MDSLVAINRKTITSNAVTPLSTPKRSRLYHLAPIAINTPYVEGLISYICRLAEAHCVSPGILLSKEILPAFRESYSLSFRGAYALQMDKDGVSVSSVTKPIYRKNPNEYGLLAWQYLEGLKLLTLRMDLETLVISPTANEILTKTTGQELGRDLRAWCPECFQDWVTNGLPTYEPLLWSIAIVTICPIHYQPLQSYCPHCQKAQRPLTSRTYVSLCSQCFGWLGIRVLGSELESAGRLDQQFEIAEQIVKVLSLQGRQQC
ncbi:MAG: TniQ family protein [Leptolyngbya sp. BL-A-14]